MQVLFIKNIHKQTKIGDFMRIEIYKNKNTGDLYRLISKTLINSNNNSKDGMVQFLYQDVLTKGLYYKNEKEFNTEFKLKSIEVDNDEESDGFLN